MNELAEDLVGQIGLVFQIRAHVVVERGGVRAQDVGQQRIVFGLFGDAQAVAAQETAVEAAHRPVPVPQQFLEEMLVLDTQVRA